MPKNDIKNFIASQSGIDIVNTNTSGVKRERVRADAVEYISKPIEKKEKQPNDDSAVPHVNKGGRPRKEPKTKTSLYISYALKDSLEDLQHTRRKKSINDLICDILQEYVDTHRY